MSVDVTSAATLRRYLSRGLRLGAFVSPEDTDVFARVSRRAALRTRVGVILDLGCGSGIPTIHACGRSHFGLGLDLSVEAVDLAGCNAAAERRDVAFVQTDFFQCKGNFSLIMSNPPYIPARTEEIDISLEVQGDGSAVLKNILGSYRGMTQDFVLHFASISNPLEIFRAAYESDLKLAYLELTIAPFGSYTSAPERLAYLLECREAKTAFFRGPTVGSDASSKYDQLLMTAHFSEMRSSHQAERSTVLENLEEILLSFQSHGINSAAAALRSSAVKQIVKMRVFRGSHSFKSSSRPR